MKFIVEYISSSLAQTVLCYNIITKPVEHWTHLKNFPTLNIPKLTMYVPNQQATIIEIVYQEIGIPTIDYFKRILFNFHIHTKKSTEFQNILCNYVYNNCIIIIPTVRGMYNFFSTYMLHDG